MAHLKLAPNQSINVRIDHDRVIMTYSRSLGARKGSIVKRIKVANVAEAVELLRKVQARATGVDVGNYFNGSGDDMGNTQEHD